MSGVAPPAGITSLQFTTDSLPKIREHPDPQYSTSYPSRSNQVFNGYIAPWVGFEAEVRNTFLSKQWGNHPIAWRQPPLFATEQVICSNEIGVVGRFQQNVGHVMTCVGIDLLMPLRFGDWHISERGTKPDITIWNGHNRPTIAGEVKAQWTCELERLMASDATRIQRRLPQLLGQVAEYMHGNRYKYSLITTYDVTMFVKQEDMTDQLARSYGLSPPTRNERVLFYSNLIRYDTRSSGLQTQCPQSYVGQVSLRECMLYLMTQIHQYGGYVDKDYRPWTRYKSDKSNKDVAKFLKYNPQPPKGGGSSYASSSKGSSYSGGYQKRSTGDALADNMAALNIQGSYRPEKSSKEPPKARVTWDSKYRTYLWSSKGKYRKVDNSFKSKGVLYVVIDGIEYLAVVDN